MRDTHVINVTKNDRECDSHVVRGADARFLLLYVGVLALEANTTTMALIIRREKHCMSCVRCACVFVVCRGCAKLISECRTTI